MEAEGAGAVLEFLIPAVEQEAALTRKVLLAVLATKVITSRTTKR